MSKAYTIQHDTPAGRGLFAAKELKAGALVLQDKSPFAAVLDSPYLTTACYWCFYSSHELGGEDGIKISACTGCQIVRYCSKACQTASWKYSHKYECKVFKGLFPQVLPNTARMMLQILQRRKAKAISEDDWKSFLDLQHHLSVLEAKVRDPRQYERETLQDSLENIQMMARAGQKYSGSSESIGHVESLVARLTTNTFTLTSPVLTPMGLYLSVPLSLVNHSCNPNCAIVYNGRTAELRVLENMTSGTELTIAYLFTTTPSIPRRECLKGTYHFECNCDQCSRGLTLDQPDASTLSLQSLEELQNSVGQLIVDAKESPDTMKLEAIAKAYQISETYSGCPPWISFLYHMRLELILALTQCQHWVAAFIQSTIFHFKVDAVVYRQASHPARVARGWVYAKQANHVAYLAHGAEPTATSEAVVEMQLAREMGLKFNLDWGLITYALAKTVSDQVLKSHGIEHRLSLEVGREMARIREEARNTRGEPSDGQLQQAISQLQKIADEGWDWWQEQMRTQRRSLLASAEVNNSGDGIGILIEDA